MKEMNINLTYSLILMMLMIITELIASRLLQAAEFDQGVSVLPAKISSANSPEPAVESDHSRHKMPSRPEGVISLDIVKKQNTIYLLSGQHEKGKQSVVLKKSTDGGKTWSQPVAVDTGQILKPSLSRSNDARLVVSGDHLLAFWTSFKEGARHNAGPMVVARSTDGGHSWQPGTSPTDWNEGPHAFFAADGDGHQIHLVWLDSRHGRNIVKGTQGMRHAYSSDGGINWSSTVTLDDITCACCWTAARLHEEVLHVLYRDKQPSDMSFGMLRGQNWQHLGTVGEFNWFFEGCPHIGGAMAFGPEKDRTHVHAVVGTGHPDKSGIYYLHTADGGKHWSSPIRMGDDSGLHGDVAINEKGRLVVVWDALSENGLAIYGAERREDGTFSDPVMISSPDVRAAFPRVVPTDEKFLVVWTQSKDGTREEVGMKQF